MEPRSGLARARAALAPTRRRAQAAKPLPSPAPANGRRPERERARRRTSIRSTQKGSTGIHSYDWHRIKTRGKVLAIGGRAAARFSFFFTPDGIGHARW